MRVAVAMSGGVDSSVAAALLREEGHEVVGLTLKVWDRSRCCSLEDAEDARRVATALGIPFYVLDAHRLFEAEVVAPFVESYRRGLTPNPCVVCNRRVKFGWLLERARALGCEVLATGHYARLEGAGESLRLRKGIDPSKDQSYFLVPGSAGGLDRVRFPLGDMTKAEVRAAAERFGLPVSRKPESQDVCFVPEGDVAGFLETRHGEGTPGEIVDAGGRVLGRHRGLHAYTVGQRRGLGIAAPEPLYVIARETAENRLVVGARGDLLAPGLRAGPPVWFAEPEGEVLRCEVKIRSTAREVGCRVRPDGSGLTVAFDEPQFGVAPGQLAVFYDGDLVLGGAWIEGGVKGDE